MGWSNGRLAAGLGQCVVAVLLAGASACGGAGGRDLGATEARVRSINQLLEKGRYADALSDVDALVQSLRIPPSGDLSDAGALALDTLVEARWRNGDTSSATLSVAERVVRWRQGRRDPRTPDSLGASGRALIAALKFDDAIRSFRAALRILEERQTRKDDRAVAEVLDGLAASLIGLAQYDEARLTVERALLIKRAGGMEGSASFARTLELQSLLAIRAGRYREARPPLDEALAIRNHQPPHPETAMTFLQLGDLAWFEGQPIVAQKAYRECLRIAEDLLRPNHPDIAYCTTRLGLMLMDSGALSDAVASFERAAAIAEVSLPTEHPLFPGYLNDLAEAHRALMDFRRARELYERALAIQERNLGPDHQNVATYVYNLALVSRDLGDFPEAKRHFERAITIWKSRLGPDHPFVALATGSLGQLLLKQGRTDEALSLLRDVVRMREASLGSNHRDTADALGSLASALVAAGRIREAMSLSARAISIWEGVGAPDAPAFAAALTIRADILAASGDVSGAADHYTRALSVTERILGADHPNAADLNVKLASLALRSGRNAAALAQALAAEEAGRRFLLLTLRYLPEREAVSYSAYRPTGLNLALSVVAASPRSEARAVESVVDAVVKNRALVFDEIAGRRTARADADQTVVDSRAAWESARQRLANLAVRAGQVETSAATNALLQEARREAERAERTLAEQSAAFRAEQRRAAIGIKEIKAALPPGSAIISFVRYEQRTGMRSRGGPPTRPIPSYLAFVITTNAASPSVVPLGPASLIDREIEDWRRQTQASVLQSVGEAAAERQFRAVGELVKRDVWNPLERHLRSANRVFVVPDGAIHLVNLAALPVGRTEYLIDRGPVLHYLTAERDLVDRPDRSAFAFEGLFALGGVAFGALSPGGPEIATNVGAAAGTRASCGSFESMQFSALPETLGEVEDVAHRWSSFTRAGRPSVELLTGAAATEGAFKKRAPGHRVVHLATHGFFLGGDCAPPSNGTRAVGGLQPIAGPRNDAPLSPTVSPLLQTGLALAGANQRAQAPPDADDGILTAEEVSGMNLQGTEWAVLSACDTGLGQLQAGEGVFGLRRAFQIAGAATVIMSLWSVEDQSTRSWMRALYDARLQQGASTADAVHRASASVLHDRRSQRQSTHPFYWAAFVAAGDWR